MIFDGAIIYGVGAQKAGTTWLYDYLRAHPGCHARAMKEVHYFNSAGVDDFRRRAASRLAQRSRADRRREAGSARDAALIASIDDWIATFGEGRADDRDYIAYLTRGRSGDAAIVDVTPAYANLPEASFERMRRLAKTARFIYILRDPVDRLWSSVQMRARRGGDPARAEALFGAQIDKLEAGATPPRCDYAGALRCLRQATDANERLVIFFEDLFSQPTVDRIADFLNVDRRPADFSRRDRRRRSQPPQDLARRATRALRGQYDYVAAHVRDEPPLRWRERMEAA